MSRSPAVILSVLAFAIAIGRTLIDWGFVYPEFGFTDPVSVGMTLVVYTTIFGVWAWSLIGVAAGGRRAAWVALLLTLLLNVLLGISTTVALCPTPCQTVWPVGELWNWATTLSGIAAVIALARHLRAARRGPA
jgi:hypothetical protein